MAFFDSALTASRPAAPSLIPRCGACGLSTAGCRTPKMSVQGSGKKGILFVSSSPSRKSDSLGVHLSGREFDLLQNAVDMDGVDLDRDCWITSALICGTPDSRQPLNNEVDYCRPNVLRLVRDLAPKVIVPLGQAAVRALVAPLWKEDVRSIDTWVGWSIPTQKYNAWVVPAHHPSDVLPPEEGRDKMRERAVFRLCWDRHIRCAVQQTSRPWAVVPDYRSQVRILDPQAAANWLDRIVSVGAGAASFDYETNRLKPDPSDAEIVCCSVCWAGKETVAFPWTREVIDSMRRFVTSPMPKIGWNKKFEERWTRKFLGVPVNNWVWDGMLSAHHLDCRRGITSAKFQGLVRCGQEDWSASIKPYLTSIDSTGKNRIREVNLRSLLVYCGIDSLIEYQVAIIQKKEMLS